MAGITMYDTALHDQFPAGAAAYAAYVDGGIGNQPNYAYTAWHVHPDVTLDGNKGLGILAFPNAATTGVVSVRRNDAGSQAVGYVIY